MISSYSLKPTPSLLKPSLVYVHIFQMFQDRKLILINLKLFFSLTTSNSLQNGITSTLGISHTLSQESYLGFPLTLYKFSKAAFSFLTDKFKNKLISQENKFLNLASCNTLIKSILSSFPIHIIQSFQLRMTISQTLNQLSR